MQEMARGRECQYCPNAHCPVSVPVDLRRAGRGNRRVRPTLGAAVETFKTLMLGTDRAIKDRRLDDAGAQAEVDRACTMLTTALRQTIERYPDVEPRIGAYVFRETSPYLMRSALIDRSFSKPRGYAGDYYTIEMVYLDEAAGEGRLGRFIDRWVRSIAPARAVRNRRNLFTAWIREVAARAGSVAPVRVTSLGSGPAREVFDLLKHPQTAALQVTCVDIDREALEYTADIARQLRLADQIAFSEDNVLRLARGQGKTTLPPQHMIYSVGLVDYLEDEYVVSLIDWIHDHLLPGGVVALGNFDRSNPEKAFMDHILEWKLIHRTAEDMCALFAQSKLAGTPVEVRADETHVNLFAFCTKGIT